MVFRPPVGHGVDDLTTLIMHPISTRLHGLLDYSLGLLLIVSPTLFHFRYGGFETWVPTAIGFISIGYSLFTDYELGVFKLLPMTAHLRIDFLASATLLASPWLFAFDGVVRWPHLCLGVLGIGIVVLSQRHPVGQLSQEDQADASHGHPGPA